MPIYEFEPRNLDDPDWEASMHKERCRAHALDEDQARELLNREFRIATRRASKHQSVPVSPWFNPALADCISSLGSDEPTHLEGLVEVWQEANGGVWVPYNTDRLPKAEPDTEVGNQAAVTLSPMQINADQQPPKERGAKWGEGEWSGTPEDGGQDLNVAGSLALELEVTVTRQVTEETVKRVVQNKVVLVSYTQILQRLLDDLIGPEGIPAGERNVSIVETLGLPSDASEEDLLALLRELRDEIRLFREALDKATETLNPTLSPTPLERLRDVGISHLNALATNKVFVSTVGASLGCSLWSLMERAGLIEMERAEALLKVILEPFK